MKLLITGAGGFLGAAVVRCALERGHEVVAVLRPAGSVPDWRSKAEPQVARADLRGKPDMQASLNGVDAVLHLAAAKGGDISSQLKSTLVGTENLLLEMREAGVDRLLLISSFSVYEYYRLRAWSTMDENSPLVEEIGGRGEYTLAKLEQERFTREWAQAQDVKLTVLRPGVVFGPGALWVAELGWDIRPDLWVRIGASAPVPLTFVENCAEAIVMAAEQESSIGETFNIVDDNLPDQRDYTKAIREVVQPRPRVVPVPWWFVRGLAALARAFDKWVLGGRAKVPGLLRPDALHARCKPFYYSNEKIRRQLDWQPRVAWREAVKKSGD